MQPIALLLVCRRAVQAFPVREGRLVMSLCAPRRAPAFETAEGLHRWASLMLCSAQLLWASHRLPRGLVVVRVLLSLLASLLACRRRLPVKAALELCKATLSVGALVEQARLPRRARVVTSVALQCAALAA